MSKLVSPTKAKKQAAKALSAKKMEDAVAKIKADKDAAAKELRIREGQKSIISGKKKKKLSSEAVEEAVEEVNGKTLVKLKDKDPYRGRRPFTGKGGKLDAGALGHMRGWKGY